MSDYLVMLLAVEQNVANFFKDKFKKVLKKQNLSHEFSVGI